jgi:hypothetical protein
VFGFLLLTSPAHADTGGLSGTLKKTTHATGLGTVGSHATKTVRHTAKVAHVRAVTHKIIRPAATHRVAAWKAAVAPQRFSRPAAHRAAVRTTAAHRIATVKPHSRHVVGKAAAAQTKDTRSTSKITTGTSKITAAAATSAGTAKTTAAAGKSAAFVTRSRDIGAPGLLRPIADAGAVLSDAIPPAVQPVLTPASRLHDRVLATVQDRIVQGFPPVVGAGGLITDPLHHVGSQPGSGPGIQASVATGTAHAPPGSAVDHSLSSHNDITTASTSYGGLTAALRDLAAGLSQVLQGTPASTTGAAAAVALLTIAVGVAAAGSASSSGPVGVSFAFVEGGLVNSAIGRAQRLGGILRQTGWRTPHRPSFSPD